MVINIEKLAIKKDKIKQLYEEYVVLYKEFYHEINNAKSGWQNNHANYFFKEISEEKKVNIVFANEYKSIVDLYEFIVRSYEDFGEKVEFNLANKENFLAKTDKYIAKIRDVINLYNNMDYSFAIKEGKYLTSELNKYVNLEKRLTELKKNNSKLLKMIAEIEKKIKVKVNSIDIKTVKGNNLYNGVSGSSNEIKFNYDVLEICTKKLHYYVTEEEKNIENLKELFSDINYCYNTSSRESLDNLLNVFLHNFKIIIRNHKNNIKLMKLNMENENVTIYKARKELIESLNDG